MAAYPGTLTRRGLIAAAAAFPTARAALSAPRDGGWTLDEYEDAMARSGRPVRLSEAAFAAIQARRPAYIARIENYLKRHYGHADPLVMKAFREVPRDYFHYVYSEHRAVPSEAYETVPKPWAIGYGSALSDYLGQAYMTQLCQAKPDYVTLEIGTGSGFQSAILSRIVREAYSIEIIEPLGRAVSRIFRPLGYDNVSTRVGDGYYGWPEVKGGFDVIIVTCAAEYAPPDLFKQLKPKGRMVIPIGQPFKRGQFLYVYTKDDAGKVHSRRDVGVFFIPMTGAIRHNAPPHRTPAARAASAPRSPVPTPAKAESAPAEQ